MLFGFRKNDRTSLIGGKCGIGVAFRVVCLPQSQIVKLFLICIVVCHVAFMVIFGSKASWRTKFIDLLFFSPGVWGRIVFNHSSELSFFDQVW